MVDEKDINGYDDRLKRLFGLEGLSFPSIYVFRGGQHPITVNLNNCIEYYLARKFNEELGSVIAMLCKVAGVDVLHGGQLIAWDSIMHHFYKKLNPMSEYGELGDKKQAGKITFVTLLDVIDSLLKLTYNWQQENLRW